MGAGYQAFYSDVFPYDDIGIVSGTVGSTNFPDVGCGLVRFKGLSTNIGTFFISNVSGTASQGYPIRAGEDSGWIATSNLNRFWFKNGSGTVDKLAYWLQR